MAKLTWRTLLLLGIGPRTDLFEKIVNLKLKFFPKVLLLHVDIIRGWTTFKSF